MEYVIGVFRQVDVNMKSIVSVQVDKEGIFLLL